MEVPSFLQSKQDLQSSDSRKNRILSNKKNLSVIVLFVLLLAIPFTVWLAQKSQIFSPKAAGGPIELVTRDGSCVVSTDPNKVSCATFPIKLTSPLGPPTGSANPSPSPSSSSIVSPSPNPSSSSTASPSPASFHPDTTGTLSNNLLSYYNFEETSGNSVADSKNINNGNATGTTVVNGKVLKARSYSGSQEYIDLGAGNSLKSLATAPFSIGVWVNPTLDGFDRVIIADAYHSTGWVLGISADKKVRFTIQLNEQNFKQAYSSSLTSGWHYIVATWSGSSGITKLYIDGRSDSALLNVGTIGDISSLVSTSNAFIGDVPLGNLFVKGTVDELGIWTKALSDQEISSLYNSGIGNTYTLSNLSTASLINSVSSKFTSLFLKASEIISKLTVPNVLAQTPNSLGSSITAAPNPCVLGNNNKCTTSITWNGNKQPNITITIRESPGSLFASGNSGTQAAPWILEAGATFDLYSGSTLINSVFVKGIPYNPDYANYKGNIRTEPARFCAVDSTGLCSVKVLWDTGNLPASVVQIKVRESGGLFASGIRGEQIAPWINPGGDTFDLYVGGQLYDSIFVTGVSASPSPSISPSPTVIPSGVGTVEYRLAETEAGLGAAELKPYTDSLVTDFTFSNTTPGVKQIWAEFIGVDRSSRKEHISVELLEPDPVITSLDCTMDISKQNLKLTFNGSRLGDGSGKVTVGSTDAQILTWGNNQVSATINPTDNLDDGKLFTAVLTRKDGKALPQISCAVNTTLISLGARLFCREPGKFDVSGVKVTLVDESGNKVNEQVTIDKDGLIQGLKTKLQVGKLYAISVKAPFSLRRNALFTAANGTNLVTQDDSSFVLPVGDIAPTILNDGKINTLDHAEIIRQWAILGNTIKTADFNRDSRVNSIDWACMRYDFNKEDDSIPSTSKPQPSPSSSAPVACPDHVPACASGQTPIFNEASDGACGVWSCSGPNASTSPLPSAGQRAAYFLIEPVEGGSYKNDDEFIVNIKLWSQKEAANLFAAKLTFDPSSLEVVRIEKGTTLTSWVEEFFDNQTGNISLTAGLPTPGLKTTEGNDPLMAKVIFKGRKVGTTNLTVTSASRIYSDADNLNILSSLLSAQIAIIP